MKLIEIQIPFAGFYSSIHDEHLDSILENDCEYLKERYNASKKDIERYQDQGIDWEATRNEYARYYLKAYFDKLEEETGLKQPFEKEVKFEITSPREYNFATDRLFVKVDEDWLMKLLRKTLAEKKAEFEKLIKERFTSRSGFISHYSNCLESWGNPRSWDHNQWCTVLETWLDDAIDSYLLERVSDKMGSLELTDVGQELWQAMTT